MADEQELHEIVIIKRGGGGHEDAHHGGVWKIAFADFMTAMMAFFLVMWLISANDKTKAVIAKYFNPVQLVDATPQRPGLSDPKDAPPTAAPTSTKTVNPAKDEMPPKGANPTQTPDTKQADAAEKGQRDEAQLFKDPYAVLAELAAKNAQAKSVAAKAPTEGTRGGSGAVGMTTGEAYRDPFEPVPMPPGAPDPTSASIAIARRTQPSSPRVNQDPASQVQPAQEQAPPEEAPRAQTANELANPAPQAAARTAQAGFEPQSRTAADLSAEVAKAAQPFQAAHGKGPDVSVKQTGEGTLIDITDGADFAMFASASAKPSPKLVALMDRIGKILKAEKGRIIVRGHTDSRPFRSDTYDNWRLSAARAHMAHYMLVRGGVDESRFDAVEGYADRRPKDPNDPEGPENRRIEILIRNTTP